VATILIIFLRINRPNFARLTSKGKSGQIQKYLGRQCLPLPLIKSAYVNVDLYSASMGARKSHPSRRIYHTTTASQSHQNCGCGAVVVWIILGEGWDLRATIRLVVNTPSKALRYRTRSQGISQFYMHAPRSSANGIKHTQCHAPEYTISAQWGNARLRALHLFDLAHFSWDLPGNFFSEPNRPNGNKFQKLTGRSSFYFGL